MTGSTQTVSALTVRQWSQTHVEFHDEYCWSPPPAAVARIVIGVVELVEHAHERGRAPLGIGPDTVLVTDAGCIRLTAPADYATTADRATDLAALGALMFFLSTGIDPDVVGGGVDARARHDRIGRLLDQLSVGNPCASGLAPVIRALLHPEPSCRPDASSVRMMLSGQAPRAGATVQMRLTPR